MELLCNVVWLEGMLFEVVEFIIFIVCIKMFDVGDIIIRQGEELMGIYLIVLGMVKVIGIKIEFVKNFSNG